MTNDSTGRQYWLWVTSKEFYLEHDGTDRRDLEPTSEDRSPSWWTCHRDTRTGDLAFLWRTGKRNDIGYLMRAASDDYSIFDDELAGAHGWDYGCD
jgi:hypothetical protein